MTNHEHCIHWIPVRDHLRNDLGYMHVCCWCGESDEIATTNHGNYAGLMMTVYPNAAEREKAEAKLEALMRPPFFRWLWGRVKERIA